MARRPKRLKEGSKPDGSKARQAADIRYCDECDKLRKDGPGWRIVRKDGYPRHICPIHTK